MTREASHIDRHIGHESTRSCDPQTADYSLSEARTVKNGPTLCSTMTHGVGGDGYGSFLYVPKLRQNTVLRVVTVTGYLNLTCTVEY